MPRSVWQILWLNHLKDPAPPFPTDVILVHGHGRSVWCMALRPPSAQRRGRPKNLAEASHVLFKQGMTYKWRLHILGLFPPPSPPKQPYRDGWWRFWQALARLCKEENSWWALQYSDYVCFCEPPVLTSFMDGHSCCFFTLSPNESPPPRSLSIHLCLLLEKEKIDKGTQSDDHKRGRHGVHIPKMPKYYPTRAGTIAFQRPKPNIAFLSVYSSDGALEPSHHVHLWVPLVKTARPLMVAKCPLHSSAEHDISLLRCLAQESNVHRNGKLPLQSVRPSIRDHRDYRGEKISLQNINMHYPGRARQNS